MGQWLFSLKRHWDGQGLQDLGEDSPKWADEGLRQPMSPWLSFSSQSRKFLCLIFLLQVGSGYKSHCGSVFSILEANAVEKKTTSSVYKMRYELPRIVLQ